MPLMPPGPPGPSMSLDAYAPVVILMGLAVLLVAGSLLVGKLIRPHEPTELKEAPYECGEGPIGQAWANFNVRFYVTALIFIIFDVEGALMFPVAAVFREFVEMGEGPLALGSFLLFLGVLSVGIIYCWGKGDLDWVRSFRKKDRGGPS